MDYIKYEVKVSALLLLVACATTTSQSIQQTQQVKPTERVVEETLQGFRPNCKPPPSMYWTLDVVEEACQYNPDPLMSAACIYFGMALMPGDFVMECGALLVQETCGSEWKPTKIQCAEKEDTDK